MQPVSESVSQSEAEVTSIFNDVTGSMDCDLIRIRMQQCSVVVDSAVKCDCACVMF